MKKTNQPEDAAENNVDQKTANQNAAEPNAVEDEAIDLSSAQEEQTSTDPQAEKIAQLTDELATAKDQTLRAFAELENFRNRKNREMADLRKYESMDLARDILPIWDNMGRALEAAEKELNAETLIEGVRMMHQQFIDVLKKRNILPIEALGQSFDPNIHESIAMLPSDRPAGEVIAVAQQGFKLHDRVVRPTQVVVSAPKPQPKPQSQAQSQAQSAASDTETTEEA